MSLPAPKAISGSTPVELLPAVTSRSVALIWNDGPHQIFIKFDSSADALTVANGLPLPRGESVTIGTPAAVTAICHPGETASVRVQDESVA